MPETRNPPKDVMDLLERVARDLQADPAFLAASADAEDEGGLTVFEAPTAPGPLLGPVDLQHDAAAITVTAETRHADGNSVHVTLTDKRLTIGLGDGPDAPRHDVLLPAAVDEERAIATFRNGVLDVVLPLRTARGHEP